MKNSANASIKSRLIAVIKIAPYAGVAVCILLSFPHGCTNPGSAVRTLEAAGYKNVEITGWRPFMRSNDDWFSTGFRAIAPNGTVVTGAVTGGLIFKGNTIRTD